MNELGRAKFVRMTSWKLIQRPNTSTEISLQQARGLLGFITQSCSRFFFPRLDAEHFPHAYAKSLSDLFHDQERGVGLAANNQIELRNRNANALRKFLSRYFAGSSALEDRSNLPTSRTVRERRRKRRCAGPFVSLR
jgi:hypothetical protein